MAKDIIKSIVAIFVLVVLLTTVILWPSDDGASDNQLMVVFMPTISLEETYGAVIKAGGVPIRNGIFDFIILVRPENVNFIKNIKNDNIVMVTNSIIVGNCFTKNKSPLAKL